MSPGPGCQGLGQADALVCTSMCPTSPPPPPPPFGAPARHTLELEDAGSRQSTAAPSTDTRYIWTEAPASNRAEPRSGNVLRRRRMGCVAVSV